MLHTRRLTDKLSQMHQHTQDVIDALAFLQEVSHQVDASKCARDFEKLFGFIPSEYYKPSDVGKPTNQEIYMCPKDKEIGIPFHLSEEAIHILEIMYPGESPNRFFCDFSENFKIFIFYRNSRLIVSSEGLWVLYKTAMAKLCYDIEEFVNRVIETYPQSAVLYSEVLL